ncbi:SDR family oxidoreductase [Flavobacteriaceae bacterium]|nr:SDR family oxidoreductase [Flavobacteriaceae bacterium]RPG65311.1 MAG: SDR family oxidoreductase [Flavobacteriaceae bacterium TMED42]MDA8763721.1 SDR family oxidoreductase [Flavobacteriaceae bacterium]MDB2314150.1 SDR family oxidoreductase [Flavobacteriaceae bacterium]MDB2520861.1 SDR family oxidoreductase [Flavobacteriaceae bacterium]
MRKNILIIGGSSGIGLALVKQLQADHNIIVANRTNEGLDGLSVSYIPYDVENDELDVSSLPETLHGMVYCPGTINLRPFKGIKPEVFSKDFSINVLGAVKTLQSVLGRLQNSETPSSVVFFSTVAVQTGMPFHTSVAAAKGALEGLSRSLAAELAPKIRFNVIAPSLVDTPLAGKFLNNDTKKSNAAARHPLQRVGRPEEIAQMTAFLLNDNSSWMTAQTLTIDGGIGSIKS